MIKSKYWLLIFIFSLVTQLYANDDVQVEKKYVRFANGDSYYGDYEGRKRNGEGVYIWANGDRYKGEFYEGKRDGSGIYVWDNGEYYKGEYVDNKRDGEGSYFWTNGERFKGDFAEGKYDEGKLTTLNYDLKIPKIKIEANGRGRPAPDRPTSKDSTEKYELIASNNIETNKKYNDSETNIDLAEGFEADDELPDDINSDGEIDDGFENVEEDTSTLVKHADNILSESSEEVVDISDKISENITENDDLILAKIDDNNEQLSNYDSNEELSTDENLENDYTLAEIDSDGKIISEIEEDVQVEPKKIDNYVNNELVGVDKKSTDIKTNTESKVMLASVVTSARFNQPSVTTQVDTPDIDSEITITNNKSTINIVSKVKVTWPNGDSYDGEYINGERTGNGTYTWANGDIYFGDFVNGKRQGVGIYKWKNGDKYIGEYLNDRRTGEGLYIWTSGDRYQGDFNVGLRHGKGTLKWIDGELYGGDFLDGKRTGKGIYMSSGGDRYEGYFKNGKRTGKGFLVSASGNLTRLEFEENPYLLQELNFNEGKLISATAEEEEIDLEQ